MDKRGRFKPWFALENSTQIDPNITGKAGRYTIGQFLQDNFGDDVGKNVAIIGGKAYTTGPDRKPKKLSRDIL